MAIPFVTLSGLFLKHPIQYPYYSSRGKFLTRRRLSQRRRRQSIAASLTAQVGMHSFRSEGDQNLTTQPANATCLQPQQYQTLLELSKAIVSHRNLTDLFHDLAGQLPRLFDFHNLA